MVVTNTYSSVIEPVKVYISIIRDYMMLNKNPFLVSHNCPLEELSMGCGCVDPVVEVWGSLGLGLA